MSSYTSKPLHQHLPLDECAAMFETLFTGTLETSLQPNHLAEEPWTLREPMGTVKVKVNPACHIGQPVSGTGAKRTNVILIPNIHIT